MNEGYLEHAGVKGMKWGVRKSDNSSRVKKTNKPNIVVDRVKSIKRESDWACSKYPSFIKLPPF